MNNSEDDFDWELEESEVNQRFNKELIPSLLSLMRDHKWDEAIQEINTFYLVNQSQDQNQGLKNSCDSWLAMMFEEKGEYDKALEINQRLVSQINPDHNLFVTKKTFVISNLFKLGQYQKALAEVEKTLALQFTDDPFDLLKLFDKYVDILDASQTKFKLQYTPFVDKIIDLLTLNFDSHLDLSNSDNLVTIVKEIVARNRQANRQYSKLVLELPKRTNNLAGIEMLKKYISAESFAFYRHLAMENLENLEFDQEN